MDHDNCLWAGTLEEERRWLNRTAGRLVILIVVVVIVVIRIFGGSRPSYL
jgi:hypothetical protein